MRILFCLWVFMLSTVAFSQQYYEPGAAAPTWQAAVPSIAALPPTGNNLGDIRIETTTFGIYAWNGAGWVLASGGGGGGGTVSSVSVVSANGLAGSVANATTTPAITLSTSVNGIVKGNGTAFSAATSGTDYQAPISTSAAVANQFLTGFTAPNTFTRAQPAFTNISGSVTAAQMLALPSANLYVGTGGGVPAAVAMSGEASIANTGAVTLSNASVIGKVLTGFSAGAGVVAATDSILQAFNKVVGNAASYLSSALTTNHIFVGSAGNVATDVAMSGDAAIVASGAITVQPNVISNSKLAQAPTLTLKGNNTGGTANEADLTVAQVNTMLGTVTSVSGTAPVVSSGGATPAISMAAATNAVDGYLTAADHTSFAAKQSALTFGSVSTTTTGVTVGSGANSTVGPNVTVDIQNATNAQPGLLTAADHTTFNAKEPAITATTSADYYRGDKTFQPFAAAAQASVSATAPLVDTAGVFSIPVSTNAVDGYLSAADHTAFAAKFDLPALTTGSVLFSDGTTIAQDNADFNWDNTGKILSVVGQVNQSTSVTDSGVAGMQFASTSHTTVDGSNTTIGLQGVATGIVDVGFTNDKQIAGAVATVTRGNGSDDGTMSAVSGFNTLMFLNSGAAGVTTEADAFLSLTFLQQGNYDKVYDFHSVTIPGAAVVTKAYGIYIDAGPVTAKENWLSGTTRIGSSSFVDPVEALEVVGNETVSGGLVAGASALTNASVGLEVGGTTQAILNPRLTTAQINALTAVAGMQAYNTDTASLQRYNGSAWIDEQKPIKTVDNSMSPYTVDPTTDGTILADMSGGNVTIVAPAAATNAKFDFEVKRIGSASNTLTISSADNLDGAGTFLIPILNSQFGFKTDGATYYVH